MCHDAGGTVPPMLAVGQALVDRGHEVTVLSQPCVAERAAQVGCGFVAFSALPDYRADVALEEDVEHPLQAMIGYDVGADVAEAVQAFRTDVAVIDCNLTGAAAAAEVSECRSAILLHSLYRTYVDVWFGELWPFLAGGANETRARFGLDPCASWTELFERHDRIYSVVPPMLEEAPTAVRSFGFLVPRFAPVRTVELPAGDDPLVLVSLSTTYLDQQALLQTILDGLGRLRVRALVTTGGQADVASLNVPPRTVVRDHVPHADVLGAVDAVVTHAGLGTVSAALHHGVPLVCTPISRDQPLNADRVAALGAGVTLGSQPVSVDEIADAVMTVLSDPSYRRSAQSVAEASRQAGGAPAVAADLLSLVD